MDISTALQKRDPAIAELISKETERQEFGLEMIPSENFVSQAVLEAMGSVLTNKYAEGLPHKRYYGGCEVVDEVEELAINRAKQLFGAQFVNVQPHSGAQANHAVFEAVLKPGDTIMGMRLDHGGHLTHGHPMNVSGKHYKVVSYGVHEDTHLIDYDQVRDLAKQNSPKLIISGASAYSRAIDFKLFRAIADEVGALLLADIAHYAGLVAAQVYPSPMQFAHFVTTTTHKTLRGPRSGLAMADPAFSKELNRAVFPGLQGGPHMHTIAAKAVCFAEALTPEFREYSSRVIANAKALCVALEQHGFKIVSGGTDSHLLLIDLRPFDSQGDLTGKMAQEVLDRVGITGNKNTIPFDPQPPAVCSGFRLGTPALTTRGMGVAEMQKVAGFIASALQARNDPARLQQLRREVSDLAGSFPLYLYRLNN